jgi:ribosomal protein S18 acetylase RimI-like enzyme
MFFQIPDEVFRTLYVMEFLYEQDMDWYEVRVFQGSDIIGYLHGYGNKGWAPQVNNIWVMEKFRRRGLASAMMSRVDTYFGQIPVPGTPIEDNDAAKGFWKKYLIGKNNKPKERSRI